MSNSTSKTVPAAPSSPSPAKRLMFFLIFGLVIAVIVGVTVILVVNDVNSRLVGARHEGKSLVQGVTVAPFASIPTTEAYPFGLVQNNAGALFLSGFGTSAVQQLDPQGNLSDFVKANSGLTAPGPMATAPTNPAEPSGNSASNFIYVIDFSTKNREAVGNIKRISSDGKVTPFGILPNEKKGLPLFAQIAVDILGNVYVTDPTGGQIIRVTPNGVGSVWWTAPNLSNSSSQLVGITYDTAHNSLLVSDVGTGSIYRIDIAGDVHNGILLYRETGLDVRALTVDDKGRVLLAQWQNDNGILGRLETDGKLIHLADGFRTPTAIIYQRGKAYVVNSDIFGILKQGNAKPPFTVDVVDVAAAG